MIATRRILTTSEKPIPKDGYETINVLKWQNGRWKTLCPYLLKTDGKEKIRNPGGVLFENFYQGCKVYDIVYSNKVYPSRFHTKPEYLWWEYSPVNDTGDLIYDVSTDTIDHKLYRRWRDSLWSCSNPIRYPNKKSNTKNTICSIRLKKLDGKYKEIRMDYITARKNIYMTEYKRLIRVLPAYQELLKMLRDGKNLLLCEIDVPSKGKKGEYGNVEDDETYNITIEKLDILLNDPSEAFGHGLCIAYALLEDL